MKIKCRDERGLLSLEACIAVTIFIFLMLFMYSFFVVFEARNAIGHAVLATADSLSLDAYSTSRLGDGDTVAKIFSALYGSSGNTNEFTDSRPWYNSSTTTDEHGNTQLSGDFSDAIRTRFLAYLGGGDSKRAEEVLQRYHIQNGADGLDFSQSYAGSKDLYLCVEYSIEYEFQVFNLKVLKMQQRACSKIWK